MADQRAPVVNPWVQAEDLPIVKLISLSEIDLQHFLSLLVTHIVLFYSKVVLDPTFVQKSSILVHLAEHRSHLLLIAKETEHDLHAVRTGQLGILLNEER